MSYNRIKSQKEGIMLNQHMLETYAEVGRILSSSSRISILTYLLNNSRSVESLSQLTGLSVANVSKHLQVLLKAGFVSNSRDGAYIVYEIADEDTAMLFDHFLNIGNDYYEKRNTVIDNLSVVEHLEPFTMQELDELVKSGKIILLDVRPTVEYEHAHIEGAVSIPVEEIKEKLELLPKNKPIVAYCRGAHCLLSGEAVKIIEESGRQAIRLKETVTDWVEIRNS